MDHEECLKRVKSHIKTPTKGIEQPLQDFSSLCAYVAGHYNKDESFLDLLKHREELEKGEKEANRVF
jgi:glucose-6-phosphate 1-dehydrogenase